MNLLIKDSPLFSDTNQCVYFYVDPNLEIYEASGKFKLMVNKGHVDEREFDINESLYSSIIEELSYKSNSLLIVNLT